MTSNKNILLDDFEMQFVYKFTDKFDNELYVFKVIKENDLKRIKKEIKKMEKDNLTTGFTYTKDNLTDGFTYTKESELYIKVKQKHIKQLKKLNFEKENVYKTNLNLTYYDYKDKQGFFTTMIDTKEVKSDDAFESD
jgi:hypothetical protein